VALHRLQGKPRQYLLVTAFIASYLASALPFWTEHTAVTSSAASNGFVRGFDWWPLVAWMKAGLPIDVAWLSHQLYLLIAIAWLLLRAGVASRAIIFWVTGLAMTVELANVAAGRGGSLTLPAIALITSMLLHALAQQTRIYSSRQRARSR
jgi:hypothetical protein